jgi:hypothetical protein
VEARKSQYADMVNKYYDLATSFYEYGGFAMQGRVQLQQLWQQYKLPAAVASASSSGWLNTAAARIGWVNNTLLAFRRCSCTKQANRCPRAAVVCLPGCQNDMQEPQHVATDKCMSQSVCSESPHRPPLLSPRRVIVAHACKCASMLHRIAHTCITSTSISLTARSLILCITLTSCCYALRLYPVWHHYAASCRLGHILPLCTQAEA